jgi:hypothetical protein
VIKAYTPVRSLLFENIIIAIGAFRMPFAMVIDPDVSTALPKERRLLAEIVEAWHRDPARHSSELESFLGTSPKLYPGEKCNVSISHDGEYAQATALADLERLPLRQDDKPKRPGVVW